MKKDAPSKLKFKVLKRRLGVPFYQVVGLLESIWRLTEMNAPAGNIGKLTNEEIAAGIEWDGDPDEVVKILTECHWLDESDEFRLVVHNWSLHVPNWLKGQFIHYGKQFADEASKNPSKNPSKKEVLEASKNGTEKASKNPSKTPSTHPNLTQPNQPSLKGAATPMPECLQTDAFQEAWSDWQQHRTEIKKPLKPTMIVQQLKWLAKLGHDQAIATIENTITKGWVGLKEPECANGTTRPMQVKPRIPTDEELLRWNPITGLD